VTVLTPTQEPGEPRPNASAAPHSPAVRRSAASRPIGVEHDEPSLADVAWTLAERRWTVAAVACLSLLAGAAYLFLAPPIYESSVLVQVEGRARPATSEDVLQLFDTSPSADAEMRMLRSRALRQGRGRARARHRGPPADGAPPRRRDRAASP
jgi:hypothetical protein